MQMSTDGDVNGVSASEVTLRCHAPFLVVDRLNLMKCCFDIKIMDNGNEKWTLNLIKASAWYVKTFMESRVINVTAGVDDAGVFYIWRDTHWQMVHSGDVEYDLNQMFLQPKITKDLLRLVRIECRIDRTKIDHRRNAIFLRNCVIELTGHELLTREHALDDFNMWAIPFDYNPEKTSHPAWSKFLNETLPDPNAQMLLQEILGYCLFKSVDCQVFFILPGPPASGKSTVLDVLNYLLGGKYDQINGKTVSPFVTARSLDAIGERFGTSGLEHSLVNLSSESTYLTASAESVIKRMTGGDPLLIEYKNQDAFTCATNPRLIVATNEIPTFHDRSGALEQRCIILPFDQQVNLSKATANIAAKLFKHEGAAIFNWALDGLIRLVSSKGMRRGKFTACDTGEDALEDHRRDSNPVVAWVDERLVVDPLMYTARQSAYEDFVSFCNINGLPGNLPLRANMRFVKAVKIELRRRGIAVGKDDRVYRGADRMRVFLGVKLVKSSQMADLGNGKIPVV